MLLTELHGYKKYQDQTFKQMIRKLADEHHAQWTSGAFGVVFIPKDKDYVYKMWVKDSGYQAYYNLATQHQNNSVFPKFIGKTKKIPPFFLRPEGIEHELTVVRIEKMKEIPRREAAAVIEALNELAYLTKDKVTLDYLKDNFEWRNGATIHSVKRVLDNLIDKYNAKKIDRSQFNATYLDSMKKLRSAVLTSKRFEKQMSDAVEAMRLLHDAKMGDELRFDLHGGNFMQRSNGEIVITDPLVKNAEIMELGDHNDYLDLIFDVSAAEKLKAGRTTKGSKDATN